MKRAILVVLLGVGLANGCIGLHELHNHQVREFSCGKHAECGFDRGKLEARYCVQCGAPLKQEP